jgi:hypothetical protein
MQVYKDLTSTEQGISFIVLCDTKTLQLYFTVITLAVNNQLSSRTLKKNHFKKELLSGTLFFYLNFPIPCL